MAGQLRAYDRREHGATAQRDDVAVVRAAQQARGDLFLALAKGPFTAALELLGDGMTQLLLEHVVAVERASLQGRGGGPAGARLAGPHEADEDQRAVAVAPRAQPGLSRRSSRCAHGR